MIISSGKKEWENEKDVGGKSKQTGQDVNLAKEKSDKGSNIFWDVERDKSLVFWQGCADKTPERKSSALLNLHSQTHINKSYYQI